MVEASLSHLGILNLSPDSETRKQLFMHRERNGGREVAPHRFPVMVKIFALITVSLVQGMW